MIPTNVGAGVISRLRCATGLPVLVRGFPKLRHSKTETFKMKGTQAAADAVTAEYGILNSLATGSGLAGSLRLRTYRARGSNDVVGHQLDVWAKTNQTDRGSSPLYGWVLEADPDNAQHILLQNPELVERALLNARVK